MGREIERKFLVRGEGWKSAARGTRIRQGYLSVVPERTVRVRAAGGRSFITIKGARSGASCPEFEYPIPLEDGEELLDTLCLRPLIEKTRYSLPFAGSLWEVDEFEGENAGLVIAEVELEREDDQPEKPEWAGQEVTGDRRYDNANLVRNPYSKW